MACRFPSDPLLMIEVVDEAAAFETVRLLWPPPLRVVRVEILDRRFGTWRGIRVENPAEFYPYAVALS